MRKYKFHILLDVKTITHCLVYILHHSSSVTLVENQNRHFEMQNINL